MWVKATELSGQVIWLNLDRARWVVRLPGSDTGTGHEAKTIVSFGADEQFTVQETPEKLLKTIEKEPMPAFETRDE